MRVPNKEKFYDLQASGKMGNHLPNWTSLNSFQDYLSDWPGSPADAENVRYMLRSYSIGAPLKIQLTGAEAERLFIEDKQIISQHAPDHKLTLQAELYKPEGHIFSMRASTQRGVLHRTGIGFYGKTYFDLRALALLKANCDSDAWEMLSELMEEYPSAIFELTCYSHRLGNLNNNTIVWEVRDY